MEDKIKLQKLILYIAIEIKRICEKNNIDYFLNSGTQLGAVRHKGFIPWDDDIDIGMTRKNYIKFLDACNRDLNKEIFYIQTEDNEAKYPFAFCKIGLLGTEIIEDFSKDVDINHGIFADIFPYDNLPDNVIKRKWYLIKNFWIKNLLWVKCGFGGEKLKKTIRYKIYKLAGCFFSIEFLKKSRKKLLNLYNDIDTKLIFPSDYPKEQLSSEWLKNLSVYEFEGIEFSGIHEFDEYLKLLYGDYMKLPPEENRVFHSNYKIDFGNYDNEIENINKCIYSFGE